MTTCSFIHSPCIIETEVSYTLFFFRDQKYGCKAIEVPYAHILHHFFFPCGLLPLTQFSLCLHHKFFVTDSYALRPFPIELVCSIFQNILDPFAMVFCQLILIFDARQRR